MFMKRKRVREEKAEHNLTTLQNIGSQLRKKKKTNNFRRNRRRGLNPCSGPETHFKCPGGNHSLD